MCICNNKPDNTFTHYGRKCIKGSGNIVKKYIWQDAIIKSENIRNNISQLIDYSILTVIVPTIFCAGGLICLKGRLLNFQALIKYHKETIIASEAQPHVDFTLIQKNLRNQLVLEELKIMLISAFFLIPTVGNFIHFNKKIVGTIFKNTHTLALFPLAFQRWLIA